MGRPSGACVGGNSPSSIHNSARPHHSNVVRRRIEYANKYGSFLRSCFHVRLVQEEQDGSGGVVTRTRCNLNEGKLKPTTNHRLDCAPLSASLDLLREEKHSNPMRQQQQQPSGRRLVVKKRFLTKMSSHLLSSSSSSTMRTSTRTAKPTSAFRLSSLLITPLTCASFLLLFNCVVLFLTLSSPMQQQITATAVENNQNNNNNNQPPPPPLPPPHHYQHYFKRHYKQQNNGEQQHHIMQKEAWRLPHLRKQHHHLVDNEIDPLRPSNIRRYSNRANGNQMNYNNWQQQAQADGFANEADDQIDRHHPVSLEAVSNKQQQQGKRKWRHESSSAMSKLMPTRPFRFNKVTTDDDHDHDHEGELHSTSSSFDPKWWPTTADGDAMSNEVDVLDQHHQFKVGNTAAAADDDDDDWSLLDAEDDDDDDEDDDDGEDEEDEDGDDRDDDDDVSVEDKTEATINELLALSDGHKQTRYNLRTRRPQQPTDSSSPSLPPPPPPHLHQAKHKHQQNHRVHAKAASKQPPEGRLFKSAELVGGHSNALRHQSARVPYQTPVVVSISDNSFVSASPAVATTTTTTTTTTQQTNDIDISTTPASFNDHSMKSVTPIESNFTTSTTATTTSGRFHAYGFGHSQLSKVGQVINSGQQEPRKQVDLLDLDDDDDDDNYNKLHSASETNTRQQQQQHHYSHTNLHLSRQKEAPSRQVESGAESKLVATSAVGPIVFSRFHRYNYLVSDSHPTPAPNERRHEHEDGKANRTNQLQAEESLTNLNSISTTTTSTSTSTSTSKPSSMQTSTTEASDAELLSVVVDDDLDESDLSGEDEDEQLNEIDLDDEDQEEQEVDSKGIGGRDLESLVEGFRNGRGEPEYRHLNEMMMISSSSSQDQTAASLSAAKYSNLIVSPQNELPSSGNKRRFWHSAQPHLASIRMVQEDPNDYQPGGGLNSALIAMLFGVGATGVLVMIVGAKMRSIRERLAHKGRRRSLVPDADFLIKTIPI